MPFRHIAPTDPRRMTDHIIELQRTLSAEVSVSGVGLHTGVLSTLTFRPAEPDHGIAFRRVDLPGMPVIPADIDHVVNTSLRTVLGCGEAVVNTVEHVLAALGGLGIDNALVDVDAAIINGNYALESKLNPVKDALVLEDGNSPYANVIVVRKGEGGDPRVAALVASLQSQKVKDYIAAHYSGGVVPAF